MTEGKKYPYQIWVESQQVPIYKGFSIPNLKTLEVGRWERLGVNGAFVQMDGTEDEDDAYIMEIPGGSSSLPERHIYEEIVYVLSGRGATTVWQESGSKVTFEWHEGSLFAIPLNAWHQFYNGQGNENTRLYVVTSAPVVFNLYHNDEFIFNCDFKFKDRFDGTQDFFSKKGIEGPRRLWETNLIEDVGSFPLLDWKERGAGGVSRCFQFSENTMCAHTSEFSVGTYKKGHKHGPGFHVIIVSGEGYSLLWQSGKEKEMIKVPWSKGSVLVPPNMWFHQHFNTGSEPARYLAIHSYKASVKWGKTLADVDSKKGGMQIEYEDEDPRIRQMFEEELQKRGVNCKMAPLT